MTYRPCPCRVPHHPRPIDIAPGATSLARSVADFAGFRAAMLRAASADSRLATWTAREQGDLGVLMIEMWAQACSIVGLADETISHECYVRTARLDESLSHLIALLGYRPRPAIASTAEISVQATGRRTITVPAGLGLRSGAVGDDPPQIFEIAAATQIHPLANRFVVPPHRVGAVGETVAGSGQAEFTSLTIEVEAAGLAPGQLAWVRTLAASWFVTPTSVSKLRGPGPALVSIGLTSPLLVDASTAWEDLEVWVPTRRANLWSLEVTGFTQPGLSTAGGISTLFLNSLDRLFTVGDEVAVVNGPFARWFTITAVDELSYRTMPDVDYETDEGDYTLPGASTLVSALTLDTDLNDLGRRTSALDTATWSTPSELHVRSGWQRAGVHVVPIATDVDDSSEVIDIGESLDRPEPPMAPGRFTLVDRDGRAVSSDGALDWTAGTVTLDDASWSPALRYPITVDANIVTATRGETVAGEILGSGDAAIPNQQYTLANAPLTYLGPAASSGTEVAVTTLAVWVDGVRWSEVPFFVGQSATARVYTTATNEDGGTDVVFGDGRLGARLSTGVDNVVAEYRWGAGLASPGPASIAQLVDPFAGVATVINHEAAYGGEDAERPDELRTLAPKSALLLGRVVSPADAVAAAKSTPGVVIADAEFAWQPDRLQSGIVVRYVGDPAIAEGLRRRLRALAERNVHIDAVQSPPQAVTVTVTVVADPLLRRDEVEVEVRDALVGERGALTPAALGIEGPLFRSRLLAAVVGVTGVIAVVGLTLDGAAFEDFAVAPPDGWHLDGSDGVTIVFEEASDG